LYKHTFDYDLILLKDKIQPQLKSYFKLNGATINFCALRFKIQFKYVSGRIKTAVNK